MFISAQTPKLVKISGAEAQRDTSEVSFSRNWDQDHNSDITSCNV